MLYLLLLALRGSLATGGLVALLYGLSQFRTLTWNAAGNVQRLSDF